MLAVGCSKAHPLPVKSGGEHGECLRLVPFIKSSSELSKKLLNVLTSSMLFKRSNDWLRVSGLPLAKLSKPAPRLCISWLNFCHWIRYFCVFTVRASNGLSRFFIHHPQFSLTWAWRTSFYSKSTSRWTGCRSTWYRNHERAFEGR